MLRPSWGQVGPSRKLVLEPRPQPPKLRCATAKHHAADSFSGLRALGCQRRTDVIFWSLWKTSSRATDTSIQTPGPPRQHTMELTTSAGIALQDAIAARYFLILFEPSRKVALRKTPLVVMPRKRHFSSDALPLLLAGVGGFLCVCVPGGFGVWSRPSLDFGRRTYLTRFLMGSES